MSDPIAISPFRQTRILNHSRDKVWKAWTDEAALAAWFGPQGTSIVNATLDLTPGGIYHYGMKLPDGSVMWGRWVFRSIEPKELLSFVSSFSDEKAGVTRHPMAATWPLELLNHIRFVDLGNGTTRLDMEAVPVDASDAEISVFNTVHGSLTQGWAGTFDKLEAALAGM